MIVEAIFFFKKMRLSVEAHFPEDFILMGPFFFIKSLWLVFGGRRPNDTAPKGVLLIPPPKEQQVQQTQLDQPLSRTTS